MRLGFVKRKEQFKFISIFTLFTFLMYSFALVLFLPKVKAAAITSASDTMSRLQISIADVTHTMVFTPTTAINQDDGVQISFSSSWGDASLDTADYSISQAAGGTACAAWTEVAYVSANDDIQFECDTVGAAGTGAITVSITVDLDNPSSVNSYEFALFTYDLGADANFGGGDDVLEDTGEIEVAIIDDDTVNVTGYIDTFLSFDLDTSEVDEDCDAAGGASPCDSHGGSSDNAGYVVDLGEMSSLEVRDSGDAGVLHADGLSGTVNSVWFDIETNADGGAAVTQDSLNGLLDGPGAATIPSVVTGNDITAGSNTYGVQMPSAGTAGTGTIVRNTSCDTATEFCAADTTPLQLFTTNTDPIATGRLELQVAAAPSVTTTVGTYTDELTYIATATF